MIWIPLGLLAALLAVALVRGIACKAAPAVQPEENIPQELADSYAQKLGDMIRIPTVSCMEHFCTAGPAKTGMLCPSC